MKKHSIGLIAASVILSQAATAQVVMKPIMQSSSSGLSVMDYATAIPKPLPSLNGPVDFKAAVNASRSLTSNSVKDRKPVIVPGSIGDGKEMPVVSIPLPRQFPLKSTGSDKSAVPNGSGSIAPQEFGLDYWPFSTARVQLDPTNKAVTASLYPYRAAGKLYFKQGTSTYMCSASLIKRGVVVTAAHCVSNGAGTYYTSFQFIPGFHLGKGAYGTWTAAAVFVLSSYHNGLVNCIDGVVCTDDIAVIVLTPQKSAYPGAKTGWFGYGYDSWGYNGGGETQITQLGYPGGIDSGNQQQRNDSLGQASDSSLKYNTIIGSNMDGGSSGGPWINNIGYPGTLTGETNGYFSSNNTVVGVTSWGYISTSYKTQGAAPFLSSNIVPLVNSACAYAPAACL